MFLQVLFFQVFIFLHFPQAAKVFIKKVIQYVPTFGWAWRCSDVIFLSRNWQEDKEVMETQVREFNDYPYPVWVSFFIDRFELSLLVKTLVRQGVQRLPLPCLGECSILFIGKFFFIIIIFKVREFNNYPYPVWVSILFFLLVKNIFLFKQIRYIF